MSVGNIAGAIDHECTGHRKCPSPIGISFLEIETGALQHVLGSVIHFKGKAELPGDLATLIDQTSGELWLMRVAVGGGCLSLVVKAAHHVPDLHCLAR